jgi:hypothetical protein
MQVMNMYAVPQTKEPFTFSKLHKRKTTMFKTKNPLFLDYQVLSATSAANGALNNSA